MNDRLARELVDILRQIRDELREINGKDAEGNRKFPTPPPPKIWPPVPYQPYYPTSPYIPTIWGQQISATSDGTKLHNHSED